MVIPTPAEVIASRSPYHRDLQRIADALNTWAGKPIPFDPSGLTTSGYQIAEALDRAGWQLTIKDGAWLIDQKS